MVFAAAQSPQWDSIIGSLVSAQSQDNVTEQNIRSWCLLQPSLPSETALIRSSVSAQREDNVTEQNIGSGLKVGCSSVSPMGQHYKITRSVHCHKLVPIVIWPQMLPGCKTPKRKQTNLPILPQCHVYLVLTDMDPCCFLPGWARWGLYVVWAK